MLNAVPFALTAALLAPTTPAAADPVRTVAEETVAAGATGVQIRTVHDGHSRTVTAGVSELDSRRPVSPTGRFRIGSTTKTFVATVVMQLVAEHRIQLDTPVERYLPGLLLRGNEITVRMLLQHTSGLYNYLRAISLDGADLEKVRYQHFSPESLVAIATARPLDFPPGSKFSYSNTNYTVLGMLIERTTGHAWGDAVTKRILRPLGMHHTVVPGDRTRIPGKHAHGYQEMNGKLVDVTELNPSFGGAAGEMISTTADLDKFVQALAAGRLLPPPLLKEMTTPRSAAEEYGLGVETRTTPCGIPVFGHTGGIPGYGTIAFTSADGKRRVEASLTFGRGPANDAFYSLIDKVICA
ncbi:MULTISPECIES: serine hydrolase [unclassified Amycolatopsis]|uniref:serine hydrolase domain-containing protein n=1 Tax=unclassified Amycolatopsis TaxID=2618356 RepID=UPI00106EA21E|nr:MULTISPECIES: serine hydrolase domain-containing protein [unclassified Amycolatopsis]